MIIAHHLHQIGAIAPMKIERRFGVFLGRLGLIVKMAPEGERSAVGLLAFERAIHAVLRRERCAAEQRRGNQRACQEAAA
jgi:hypothetical protein